MNQSLEIKVFAPSLVLLTILACDVGAEKRHEAGRSISSLTSYELVSTEGATIPALEVFNQESRGMSGRRLFRSPDGRHFVLEDYFDPRRGEFFYRLVDDASGWWIESRTTIDATAPTTEEFFALNHDGTAHNSNDLQLRTSGGLAYSGRYMGSKNGHQDFMADSSFQDFIEKLQLERPPEVLAGVRFLALLAESDPDEVGRPVIPFTWRPTIDSVLATFDLQRDRAVTRWEKSDVQIQGGTAVIEPALLEFMSGFRGVENADPLAGASVLEVLGEELD